MAKILVRRRRRRRNLARSSEEHERRFPQAEGPNEHLRNALMVLQTFPYAGSETEIEDQLDAVSTVVARIRVALGQIETRQNPRGRRLTVPEQHKLKIARQTLKMTDVGARVMGGPTKAEAREIVRELTGKAPPPPTVARADLSVDVWEERDRLHIALKDADGDTIAEWWDDDARQMFEDGFFDSRKLEQSVVDYAASVGLVRVK